VAGLPAHAQHAPGLVALALYPDVSVATAVHPNATVDGGKRVTAAAEAGHAGTRSRILLIRIGSAEHAICTKHREGLGLPTDLKGRRCFGQSVAPHAVVVPEGPEPAGSGESLSLVLGHPYFSLRIGW
jgi:hypothetical protein